MFRWQYFDILEFADVGKRERGQNKRKKMKAADEEVAPMKRKKANVINSEE